ncbi:MAG: class I SAM-dependent methyltransferase [Alphaproteobacteria bacterium]|nr:class I SAM-dependent methyltransferase [Alphaproteobacteria bacterium]
MHKYHFIKIICLLIFGFINQNSSIASDEEDKDTLESIKQWVPARLHDESTLTKIRDLIDGETHTKIENNPDDNGDYGFSMAYVNAAQRDYLQLIKEMYESTHKRPQTIDVGAGHGFMTRNALIAGGKVHALEQQKPTYEALRQKVGGAKEFLAEGETIASLCKVLTFNAFRLKDKQEYKEHYDYCWAGNIIHLMAPTQAKELVSILFQVTKPGGIVYATAHSAGSIPSAVELFYENKAKGIECPGYMFLNRTIYRRYEFTGKQSNIRIEDGQALPFISEQEETPPSSEKHGLYGEGQTDIKWIAETTDSEGYIAKRHVHTIMHFFNPESLTHIFKAQGFDIEDAYYIGNDGEKVPFELSEDELKQNRYSVAVKAKKPSIN